MKQLLFLSLCSLFFTVSNAAEPPYQGSIYGQVWNQIQSDAYSVLPQNKIGLKSLGSFIHNKIKQSAERTLSDRSDILPQFVKLAHPNGVCLKGSWQITQDNPYGGYFKKDSHAMIIARASVAMSETKKGKFRGFGMAGKLFPTTNPEYDQKLQTANFFTVDDLGGTKAAHYTDVGMTNEPAASVTTTVVSQILYAIKIGITFGKADNNPGIRQLYEISQLGVSLNNLAQVKTPKWMMIKARPGQTVDEEDFRDELSISNYNGHLYFDIFVTSSENKNGEKEWQKIGQIHFTDSQASNSCDHRLHFHHPKWRSDLVH